MKAHSDENLSSCIVATNRHSTADMRLPIDGYSNRGRMTNRLREIFACGSSKSPFSPLRCDCKPLAEERPTTSM